MKIRMKLLCICACLLIGISIVLPYFSVSAFGVTISKNLMDCGEGVYILIIAGVALILSLFGKYIPSAILGMVSFGFFFYENGTVTTNLGKEVDALARTMIQNGLGYYCLLMGSVALVLFSVLAMVGKKEKQSV